MKKVTETIANAFKQGLNKSLGNTSTDGKAFYLHGNKIAEWRTDGLYMTLASWNTATTRERLNGIAEILGLKVSFTQKAFKPYLNRALMDSSKWYNVSNLHLNAVREVKTFDATPLGEFAKSL